MRYENTARLIKGLATKTCFGNKMGVRLSKRHESSRTLEESAFRNTVKCSENIMRLKSVIQLCLLQCTCHFINDALIQKRWDNHEVD